MTISRDTIIAERLRRQGLIEPVETAEKYTALFKALQPVSPPYFSYPGSPPALVHRAAFDDRGLTADWRRTRKIVKGRFLGGTLGYVFAEDLALYGNAFQRPLTRLNERQELVYNALLHVGPLTPRQLKEETGLLNKELMPILHRLQEAFLVYEDQADEDWERPWYVFAQEWPGVSVEPDSCEAAAKEVLHRFLHAHVLASAEQIRNWSGWPLKDIKHVLQCLEADGVLTARQDGWMRTEDTSLASEEPARSVFMLHRADPLVRASASELKERFAGPEALQYLLIDGEFNGVVCGHWRIGPHDAEDIVVHLPDNERAARKDEIVEAVAWKYHPPNHHILRYDGEDL